MKNTYTTLIASFLLILLTGCGNSPPATVEGTLRLDGQPLDNCLVTFMPNSGQATGGVHYSSGVTDAEGHYRLRADTQQRGATTGWHKVTIRDLSASSGIPRHDHGSAEIEKQKANVTARPSRLPPQYGSPQSSPIDKEVKEGHQVIDLDIP